MKAIDVRSESAVKLLSEFLDMDIPTSSSHGRAAEHFSHELYCYVRSPYKNLFVYDSVVQYDPIPENHTAESNGDGLGDGRRRFKRRDESRGRTNRSSQVLPSASLSPHSLRSPTHFADAGRIPIDAGDHIDSSFQARVYVRHTPPHNTCEPVAECHVFTAASKTATGECRAVNGVEGSSGSIPNVTNGNEATTAHVSTNTTTPSRSYDDDDATTSAVSRRPGNECASTSERRRVRPDRLNLSASVRSHLLGSFKMAVSSRDPSRSATSPPRTILGAKAADVASSDSRYTAASAF
ncbi:hypothetical protein FISHEDRAFT_72283 [Fistulina hepatica ATCC 64428]|uniref:Uncharacterized protein n=1 Tax=Fistulina hepatica ATCC 64428 TaxID=1128425 RepID=A0A0D7AFN2_9AGAR|nr:hypothetical protein FISHEDRAFT_72283 [Fistulina hepatica ATCC 64428]